MSKVQFIFSTRYLGEKYPFEEDKKLEPTTPIYNYLRDCLISPKVLLNSILAANLTEKELTPQGIFINPKDLRSLDNIKTQMNHTQTRMNYIKFMNQLISEGIVSEVDGVNERINNCPGKDSFQKLQSRFSYYCLKKDPHSSAYAVPHLNWRADKEWIKALIDWSIQLDSDEQVELYLVMHDKDVPGFQDEPYKYLTAEQIFNVLQNQERTDSDVELKGDSEKRCYYHRRLVNIIVFQHTDNDVVDLLNDVATSFQTIVDKLMEGNRKAMKELFSSTLPLKDFNGFLENLRNNNITLKPACSVDVSNKMFAVPLDPKPKKLSSNRDYYDYSDHNGALLTDLMHVRTTANSSKAFKNLVDYLVKPKKDSENQDLKKMRFPIIIQVYKSFFDDWAKAVPEEKETILGHRNKKALDENLDRTFSFFNNSSIWIRLVDINKKEEYDRALLDFRYFDSIGLYDYDSAWENLEYNIRVFSENYLESALDGHGNYVTPMLYGNESKYRDIIVDTVLEERNPNKPHNSQSAVKGFYLDAFFDVAMRILLIDDKIADCDRFKKEKKLIDISAGDMVAASRCCCSIHNKSCKRCKLRTVSQLLEKAVPVDRFGVNDGSFVLHDYFHWEENDIETYVCPTITKDFLNHGLLGYEDKMKIEGLNNYNHVQIVGVRDVRTALLLLSRHKFDMVFCDYLLDYKNGGSTGPRDYSNQLFDFLSTENDDAVLENLRRDVLGNRGPLDKLWIMPITGFNQSFIQDLYRQQIDLIGHKWNISNGADPITTPWQFLYHLNKFVELLLKQCVYRMDQLLRFLLYSCMGFVDKFKEVDSANKNFFAFQAFMGSEYASFMRRFGNRLIIRRDAAFKGDGDTDTQSVFATYVWNRFYANLDYRDEIELNRLIHCFLYQASNMHNDREGKKKLGEDFGFLCHFIDNNLKVREIMKKDKELNDNLDLELNKLRTKMDVLTRNQLVDENSLKNH